MDDRRRPIEQSGLRHVVDCDFPGGNIVVDRVEDDAVFLHQELRDTTAWWFYWYFRVRGAGGRTLTFHFTQGNVIGARGPSVSSDGGATWRWLGPEAVHGCAFTYTFGPDENEIRFAFSLPYVEDNLRAFLARHATSPSLQVGVLCHTRKGRPVEVLHLGRLDEESDHRIVLTCRHHACESVASYVLEGLMETVLAVEKRSRQTATGPALESAGLWLREHVAFMVVPFVDKDGVEDGDQGKYRHPRDHNRDYDGPSTHATTAALRETVPGWSKGKLSVALDLHCPYISGEHSEVIYFVGGPDQENWSEVLRFSELLEVTQTGSLRYAISDNMPFGQGWNTAENTVQGRSFARWAAGLPGIALATSLETPYANVAGAPVTAEAACAFGRDLARALHLYLRHRV